MVHGCCVIRLGASPLFKGRAALASVPPARDCCFPYTGLSRVPAIPVCERKLETAREKGKSAGEGDHPAACPRQYKATGSLCGLHGP